MPAVLTTTTPPSARPTSTTAAEHDDEVRTCARCGLIESAPRGGPADWRLWCGCAL